MSTKPKPREKKQPKPDAEGWIPHVPGDKCPCDGRLMLDAMQAGMLIDNRPTTRAREVLA